MKTSEELATEFFKKRFPEKNIEFEKKCGYFGEWVSRINTGSPERFMDDISLKVWQGMSK